MLLNHPRRWIGDGEGQPGNGARVRVPPAAWVAAALWLAGGCGGAAPATDNAGSAGQPGAPLSEPLVDDLGRRLHALYGGAPEATVVLSRDDLERLLEPRAAERVAAQPRLDLGPAVAQGDPLGGARYLGVCVQGVRLEPPGGPLGLREERWVLDRALVVGIRPGRRRVAAWVEGVFVRTTDGVEAIALQRLERPRWEHSDLDLAPCDMGSGRWDPQYIGDVIE